MPTNPPIAIIGAGPAGLVLARLLELAKIDYTVFERDVSQSFATAAGGGGTLDIHVGTGQAAIQEAGLMDQFRKLARGDAPTVITNKAGKVYLDSRMFVSEEGGGGHRDRPEIDRKDLRAMLLASVPESRIRWGMKVREIAREPDGRMAVTFVDGTAECGFRLVIGADGAWSKARSLITSAKPQYSGYYYIGTRVAPANPNYELAVKIAGNGARMICGDNKQVTLIKLGNNSYEVALGLKLPESWKDDKAELFTTPRLLLKSLVDEHFVDWPKDYRQIILNGDTEVRPWPLYAMPPESLCWETVPGVALIGDAAHLSTPFMGEGVNCAMFDSLQLAQQIIKHGLDNLDAAVAEYEKEMFPRGRSIIERSARSGQLMFADDAPRGWMKEMTGIDIE